MAKGKPLTRPKDIRAFALAQCETAIRVLAGIARQKNAPIMARIAASQALMDRGLGKAAQPITGQDGEGPVIVRIERIIVGELLLPDDTAKPLISNDAQSVIDVVDETEHEPDKDSPAK